MALSPILAEICVGQQVRQSNMISLWFLGPMFPGVFRYDLVDKTSQTSNVE